MLNDAHAGDKSVTIAKGALLRITPDGGVSADGYVREEGSPPLHPGDRVAIFDNARPAMGANGLANAANHDIACIASVADDGGTSVTAGLGACDGGTYALLHDYAGSSSDHASVDFSVPGGRGAGIGALPASSAPADTLFQRGESALPTAFDDGYVEFVWLKAGSNPVPYLGPTWFGQVSQDPYNRRAFLTTGWFSHYSRDTGTLLPPANIKRNIVYIMTVGSFDVLQNGSYLYGVTTRDWSNIFIFAGTVPSGSTLQRTTAHEVGHLFALNGAAKPAAGATCPDGTRLSGQHDCRIAWCATPGMSCEPGTPPTPPQCLMRATMPSGTLPARFCLEDLLLGDPSGGGTTYSIRGCSNSL